MANSMLSKHHGTCEIAPSSGSDVTLKRSIGILGILTLLLEIFHF